MKTTTRNHYLPQFYLEAFRSLNQPRIFWVYDKRGGEPRPQTPINTGIERHLYNFERPDGSTDDSIEKQVFAPIEGKSKEIFDRLLPPRSRLNEKDMGELAGFLAFMATRVPRSIQAAREVGSALASFMTLKFAKKPDEIRKALSLLQEQGTISKDLSVEQMQAILESTDKDFYISFNEKPAMALSLKMSKAIHYELVRMNWCLCRAPSDTEFISGDAPLVCFVLDKNGRAIFGGGYGTPNAEVTFPLSPEKCLYLDHRHNQRYRAVNHKLVKEINKRTAWAAERFIVSRHKSDYAAELSFWSSKSINMPKMDKRELFRQFELKNLFD